MARIITHEDLEVYQIASDAAAEVFSLSQAFPEEEQGGLTEPLRQASRAVCLNIAQAWRKRRAIEPFVAALSEAEAEAGRTQSWLAIACSCEYLPADLNSGLQQKYDYVLGKLVRLIANPEPWILRSAQVD